MGRSRRSWISQNAGSFHIISRVMGGDIFFNDWEKEYFMKLMERLASGFFVQIHAFCIMSNHFHILASGLEEDAQQASIKELSERYLRLYPKEHEFPPGAYQPDGTLIPDEDGGVQRLRDRLGSISRFVQELKQSFSRWYNKAHNRKGYLWSERFKGVILNKGEAQLLCSTYIDLNPVRANIVKRPEDYRWCSLGLRVRSPKRAKKLLTWFLISEEDEWSQPDLVEKFKSLDTLSWYRELVYLSGGIECEGKASISKTIQAEVIFYHGKLGLGDSFRYRVRNISEGIGMGSYNFIKGLQERFRRKFIRPRGFLPGNFLYTTRVLRR